MQDDFDVLLYLPSQPTLFLFASGHSRMAEEEDLSVLVMRWQSAFKRATDFDTWGQPVEAIDVYQRLAWPFSLCQRASGDALIKFKS